MGRFCDLKNKRFGRLLVSERTKFEKLKPHWKCICDCGAITIGSSLDLKSGDKKSCGCLRKDLLIHDITNKKFGKLTVIHKAPKRGKSTSQFWECICECGQITICSAQHLSLKQKRSCGKCDKLNKETLEEFLPEFKKNIIENNNCWEWMGRKARGYGVLWAQKMIKAHRFSYLFYKGQIPKNKIVCHSCDNPSCVNPNHLWLGTHKENAEDRDKKGRQRKPKRLKER